MELTIRSLQVEVMKMKNSLDELLAVLEEIRKEKHPEIPSSVIKDIAAIQRDNQERSAVRQGKLKNYFNQVTEGMGKES